MTYPLMGLNLSWPVVLSQLGEMELKLVWLLALGGASCSKQGVDETRLLNLGILESWGDVGGSLGVVDMEALAPEEIFTQNK